MKLNRRGEDASGRGGGASKAEFSHGWGRGGHGLLAKAGKLKNEDYGIGSGIMQLTKALAMVGGLFVPRGAKVEGAEGEY